jgi:peptidoglycan/xylan/chitin deacetylase (PgdA/CDA1 family)
MKATIQVDMDGIDAYLRYSGRNAWAGADDDVLYRTAVPRFLKLFRDNGIKATFFVIGKDTKAPWKRKLVERIAAEGHEVANHTMNHVFGFRKLSRNEKETEIEACERALERITGETPVGFRAPGYDVDEDTIDILENRGYKYDSSVVPTFVYPALMLADSLLNGKPRHSHGPRAIWGFAPLNPYHPDASCIWKVSRARRRIFELPVATMPVLRIPFYGTFVLTFGKRIFDAGKILSKVRGVCVNYVFHIVDLSDRVDGITPEAGAENVYAKYDYILKSLLKDYEIVRTKDMF